MPKPKMRMYYVLVTRKKSGANWVEAITPWQHAAESRVKKMPAHLKAKIVSFKADEFPVYVIEKARRTPDGGMRSSFKFHGQKSDVIKFMKSIKLTKRFEKDDYACAIIYKVPGPWASSQVGLDYMGELYHQHVGVDVVKIFREGGLDMLFMSEEDRSYYLG